MKSYVEGMPHADALLDLLSAVGSDEIEPTKAVGARQPLYPEVGPLPFIPSRLWTLLVSAHGCTCCWGESRSTSPRTFQCQSI